MPEKAMLSHEAGRHFILILNRVNIQSIMVIARGLFLSLFSEIVMRQGGDL